jgi:HAD superfamily hydrolase (TIGR01490 family)
MNLALFDFDGTITTREMLPDFIRQATSPRRLAVGMVLLAPLIVGYRLGVVSGTVVRAAIVRFGCTGMPLAALEAHGASFAESALPLVLRAEALARIDWHKRQGDTIVVVSGAFDVYLRHWCREHRLALICSTLEHSNGVLTGRYLGRQCVLEEKARRVRAAYDLSRYDRIYAYGDTKEDLGLLALAHERYYRWQPMPPD